MKKLLLLAVFSLPAFGQSTYVASQYGTWQSYVSSGSTSSIVVLPAAVPLTNGQIIVPFAAGTPITIERSNGNAETVTPTSATNCYAGSIKCTLAGTFGFKHPNGANVQSGTFGLQEAINAAITATSGTVLIDGTWGGPAGASLITAATGSVTVVVQDNRSGTPQYYQWNGSAYVVMAVALCAENYLYLDTAHSGQDYGVAINAAILTQQNAFASSPVQLCVTGQHKVWTPIVDAWNVPLDFNNAMLVPQSGGAGGIWGASPITVAGCTITIGSQNLSCPSITGLTDRMRIGGVGIPSGAYIQGAPTGNTVHISLQPSLMFNAPTTAASNQLCGVSSEQGLATGQGITGPPGGTIPASTTITAIAPGGGSATQTQCLTMSNNATAAAAAPASIYISSGSTITTKITAEAVAPVIRVPFNPPAYRQGTNWSNTFRNIWIVDPGMAVSQTGIGRTLTGVQCFQVYGWDQILQENLHCQGLAGAGLILGGMVPVGTLTQGQVVRESKFLNYQIRSTGEPATGQSSIEMISGEEGCPFACISGADEDNTITLSGNIVYPFSEAVTIATYNTTHTLTNGPRIIHIIDSQIEDTGSTLPKASIAAPFDLVHCIQCGDIYLDDSYLSTSGYGKSVIRVDTGNLFNVTNSQFSDSSNLIAYTVTVTNGSTLVTYVSGGPGYFENQGLSDGIGGQMADATGSLCTVGAPCNVYLAPSGSVSSTTTLNLSAPYFGTTGTSTFSVGASGYYWNVSNTLTTFNSMFNYYVDPGTATVALLSLVSSPNAWHVGGAQFPFGTTDYNKQLIANGASQFIGAATFVSPVTGRNTGSFTANLAGTLYSAAGTPLPTCAVGIQGGKYTVKDATAPAYMSTYVPGGGITADVICSFNGTTFSWLTK